MNHERCCQPVKGLVRGEADRAVIFELDSDVRVLSSSFNLSCFAPFVVVNARREIEIPNEVTFSQERPPGEITGVLRIRAASDEPDFGIEVCLNTVVLRRNNQLLVPPRRLKLFRL